MKNEKILLMKFLTVLMLSVLIVSCDDHVLDNPDEEVNKSALHIKSVFKKDIQENAQLLKKVSSVNQAIAEKRRDPIYSDQYNMVIETDYAELIENEDGTIQTYTFDISREVENGLMESFVLSLQEDGTYKGYYVSYDISDQEALDIRNGVDVDIAGRT